MLEQMTARQAMEWEEMFRRWHIGESPHERDDLSAAIVSSTIANVNRGKGKVIKIDAFLPEFKEAPDEAANTADTLRANMLKLANRGKGKPNAKPKPTTE
jgi:hypothetical protein